MASILVISCSPREGGNTELLLQEVVKGASGTGADVEFTRLQEFSIEPCRECLSCHSNGECVVQDDMQTFYPKIVSADAIILGSPIFFLSLPAHAKAFIDRCQPFWAMKYLLKTSCFPNRARHGAFVGVAASPQKNVFDGAVKVVKALFASIEVGYDEEILVNGIDNKGRMLEHPQMLKRGYNLGVRIAELVMAPVR